MAIDSWTSEGMDWTSLKSKRYYPYVQALVLAMQERWTAIVPGSTLPVYWLNIPGGRAGLMVRTTFVGFDNGWGDRWDWFLDNLVRSGNYIDYEDNGGNWDDVALGDKAPHWTWPTMLASIGDSEWIRATQDTIVTEAWALQMYRILNKLVWRETKAGDHTNNQTRDGVGVTWADAVASFAADTWHDSPGYANDNYHFARRQVGVYSIDRRRGSWSIGPFTPEVNHKLDLYFYYQKETFLGNIDVYENNDYPSANVDKWHLQEQVLVPTSVASHSYWVGNFNNVTVTEPALGIIKGWATTRAQGTSEANWPYSVVKWNVTGGFKFVDHTV